MFLIEVKHLTKHQRDAEVYTIYTYGSLVVVFLLAMAKILGLKGRLRCPSLVSDKAIILLGCSGRMATRLLLLYGTGLRAMQLMQVVYSLGIAGEFAFYAYCLKVVPGQSQRLTAITQATYLVSHTIAGLLGDWLLKYTDIGLMGLMQISACSVFTASLIACTFRTVEPDVEVAIPHARNLLVAIYRSRHFWLSSLWWTWSYTIYSTVYGYESSIYFDSIKGHDDNGTIFAIGLLAGAACALLLSLDSVQASALHIPLTVFVSSSLVLAVTTAAMGSSAQAEWFLPISFTVFFMSWSFANTLFYGETRRAVDTGVTQADRSDQDSEALATRVVSAVFILNSAVGTLANGLLALVLFTWLGLSVEAVFRLLAALQAAVTLLIMTLSVLVSLCSQPPHAEADGLVATEMDRS